jgi:putative tricarboxylic transport membrane protein
MIGGIALLSLGLIVRDLLRGEGGEAIAVPDRAILAKMGLFTLLMIAYAALFMTLGYIPSTAIVFVIGLLLFNERRIFVLIIFPLVMTGAIYLGFTRVLGVWLP